ncbi:hypothetical protein INT47_011682 [Mucor saturninus]|uniref:F-box domain-containing protein n=1 Tax=Mucor saturninus TaxID=64648 RepID=A0A8H7V502_9FUNG|nr:hypothetical protein INT47_011682 [Mucor saturninus]
MTLINRLSDDCLELIFIACDGCPWTLCTLSQVCRQWYAISHRPSVWRKLVIDKPNFHAAYTRLLSSSLVQAVRSLYLSKPIESRHAHLRPLPFQHLTQIEHLHTSNLCLAEIDHVSQQLVTKSDKLGWLVCTEIETWCDSRRFSADLIQKHTYLERVQFEFKEDGHSGFAPIHTLSKLNGELTLVKSFRLTSIRDEELLDQRNILTILENTEETRDELYHLADIERYDQGIQILLQSWDNISYELNHKYEFMKSLRLLERLHFGFCFAWTPLVWRETFGTVMQHNAGLSHLSLHGWDQLGKLSKVGHRCSVIQPVRADAEAAISECFAMMSQLEQLQLVDFSIGPGLLGEHMPKSIQYLEIEYTRAFPSHFTEPSDIWLLVGPIKDFVAVVFSNACDKTRKLVIRLDPSLAAEVEINPFFKEEPFLESIQNELKDKNIEIIIS